MTDLLDLLRNPMLWIGLILAWMTVAAIARSEKLLTIFRVPELRTKILFTLGLLAIYRLGFWVPLPIVNQEGLRQWAESTAGGGWDKFFGHMAMFSGTQLGTSTIFGLGIMPYISASIIFQLLASVVPSLEALQKEGEVGRKKINEYTRYATVGICLIQSAFWVKVMFGMKVGTTPVVAEVYQDSFLFYSTVCVLVMTSGSVFLMWLGEQIDEYGIGNGISLIIMAGIVAQLPGALILLNNLVEQAGGIKINPDNGVGAETLILLAAMFIGVVVGVVMITQGQRRIPTQSAKHVRGRRVFGGNRQYLPLRVNQAGVMPIIFASSLLMFPTVVLNFLTQSFPTQTWLYDVKNSFDGQGFLYLMFYIGMIYFFCFFWTMITFNPKDMASNLKDYGAFVPGYRPGKPTAAYLERVMNRITYVGAAFLSVVAIIPMVVAGAMGIPWMVASFFGGTGLLIVVSVALDLVQKIDSHLIMRNYDSLITPGND